MSNGSQLVAVSVMHDIRPDPQTFQIIGAAMEVHRHLPRGMLEAIYCEALEIEFELRNIPFIAQYPIQVDYKGRRLTGVHRIDFVCFDSVVIEVKALSGLTPANDAQLLNYMAMKQLARGLLLNFGSTSLEYRRRVL
jgi:GxxExxY protein